MDNVVAASGQAAREGTARDGIDSASKIQAGESRGAPAQVTCLLPVWGLPYVRRFLTVALPTWLAPGNLPALVRELPAEMVILTTHEDEAYLRAHPGFKRLADIIPVRLQFIDHLVTGNNYSTTITLAYTEAVRGSTATLDTCFFFLVGDYIVADGSFAYIISRMKAGLSGMQVGNFQVAEEDASTWLQAQIEASPGVIALPPRQLVNWGLAHLHPATVANTVNFGALRNVHTNRLFWRVDGGTLIGRFFLMHMICIRPETTDFVISSSCDYSFVPEMCPSGNVEIVTDSDQYLVIEMQPRRHEASFLRPGKHRPALLAGSLSEWTTKQHRRNADTTVVFHADAIPDSLPATVAEANAFLEEINTRLVPVPRPHRNHSYWNGAMAAFREATGASLTTDEKLFLLGYIQFGYGRAAALRRTGGRLLARLTGEPPNLTRWHPRWADYSPVLTVLRRTLDAVPGDANLLLVGETASVITTWIADGAETIHRMRTSQLITSPESRLAPLTERFDVCLIELSEVDLKVGGRIVERVELLMRDGGTIIVSVMPRTFTGELRELNASFTAQLARLMRPSVRSLEFECVPANALRRLSYGGLAFLFRSIRTSRMLLFGAAPIAGPPLLILGWMGNWMTRIRHGRMPAGPISSALVTLVIDSERARDSHQFLGRGSVRREVQAPQLAQPDPDPLGPDPTSAPAIEDVIAATELPLAIGETAMPQAASNGDAETREPQYNRCLEIKARQGLTSLGLMTNQVWEDDPRRLAILLSRYKFVAKMLSGRKFVGELGCGDAFGTRIVLQEVERVVAYDFDPVFIEDIHARPSERWPIEALVHDILASKLPHKHDAIYSLDVMEHIRSADEDTYLRNLRDSLVETGVLIIGSPSLESQAHASPPSKVGHINCKSGAELKALLRHYFDNVFLFSMNDEVVHTGYYPMAHYLFAVCCQKKILDEDFETGMAGEDRKKVPLERHL